MEINRLRQEECPVCMLEFDMNFKQPVAGKKYNNQYCSRHVVCLYCINHWTSTQPLPGAHHELDIPCPVCKDRLIGCIPIFPGMTFAVGINLETNKLEMIEDVQTGGYIQEVGDDVLNPVQRLPIVQSTANDDEQGDQGPDQSNANVPDLDNINDAEQGGGGELEAEVGGDGGQAADNDDSNPGERRRVRGRLQRVARVDGAGAPGGGQRRRRTHQQNLGEFNQQLNMFVCRRCGGPLSTRKILARHWRQVHAIDRTKFQCDQCPSYFTRHESLRRHVRDQHPQV